MDSTQGNRKPDNLLDFDWRRSARAEQARFATANRCSTNVVCHVTSETGALNYPFPSLLRNFRKAWTTHFLKAAILRDSCLETAAWLAAKNDDDL